ncbi:hypothetical protein CPB86DRAFT_869795 [Serendipita vermifera]|nr:hypothetical protein CPB86DRAFT_869795 [Serendipita vermifera]
MRSQLSKIVLIKNRIGALGATTRGYRTLVDPGTFPPADPRSIYDFRVKYSWVPRNSLGLNEETRRTLQTAVMKELDISLPGLSEDLLEFDEVKELNFQLFFVPYWLVRIGLYLPIDHKTMRDEYSEGRLAADITFSSSGTSHHALKDLQFLSPTTEISDIKHEPRENFINIPFSRAPPFDIKPFIESMTDGRDLLITRNVRIQEGQAKLKIAALPVLEAIALGEYQYKEEAITAANCLRLGQSGSRIYRNGAWRQGPEPLGPSKASYSIAWKDNATPHGVDQHFYDKLLAAWQGKSRQWLRHITQKGVGAATISPETWRDSPIGIEEVEHVKKWTRAKLDLWQEGYEYLIKLP